MGKVIKFPSGDNNEKEDKTIEHKDIPLDEKIKQEVGNYIKKTFAVKEILEMEIKYKVNNTTIGVIGIIAYKHKRREGTFIANFIGNGLIDKKGKVSISEIAFEAGEPELYKSIYNLLKAKEALPEIQS